MLGRSAVVVSALGLALVASQANYVNAREVTPAKVFDISSYQSSRPVAPQSSQECMICTSTVFEDGANHWVYIMDWGGLECEGYEQFEDICVRCDDFPHVDEQDLECGESGDSVVDDSFYTRANAEEYGEEDGCEIGCHVGAPVPALAQLAEDAEYSDDLVDSIVTNQERIVLNAERLAIQGSDCSGRVILHIPLTREKYERLMTAIAARILNH